MIMNPMNDTEGLATWEGSLSGLFLVTVSDEAAFQLIIVHFP